MRGTRFDRDVLLGPCFAVQGHEGARQGQRTVQIDATRQQRREIGDTGGRARRRFEWQVAAFTLRSLHQAPLDQGDFADNIDGDYAHVTTSGYTSSADPAPVRVMAKRHGCFRSSGSQ